MPLNQAEENLLMQAIVAKKQKRRLDKETKLRIINLRYGSLVNFDQPVRDIREISKALHLPWSTIQHFLRAFDIKGKQLQNVIEKPPRRFSTLPPNVQTWLLSKEILQCWAPFSLKERVLLLQNAFGILPSPNTLWEFYKERGIQWKTGKAIYRAESAMKPRLQQERYAFARLLAKLIEEKKHIIFMDETTVNTWQIKTKSWSSKTDIVEHKRPSTRIGITVFGAIGNCLKNPVFRTAKSTNKTDYIEFMRLVKEQVRQIHHSQKPILLFDAHRAHTSLLAREEIPRMFVPLKIPVYSCEFNSIEKVWSYAKT